MGRRRSDTLHLLLLLLLHWGIGAVADTRMYYQLSPWWIEIDDRVIVFFTFMRIAAGNSVAGGYRLREIL